jgi:hypothetical protein
VTGTVTTGCRVNETDVRRWELTEHGPDKLVAVMSHDKYEMPLRVEAAMALVRMKPRGGRRVGISRMVEALASLSPEARKTVVGGLIPTLTEEMAKPLPVVQAGQAAPPDGSIAYKDAAFAILSNEKVIVTEEEHKAKLGEALVKWVAADFERRFDNASQMFGVEQVVRFLGGPAVKPLPALIGNETRKFGELAKLISEHGDPATKEEASKRLVDVAKYTVTQGWIDKMKAVVEEANRIAKLNPTPEQLKKQLEAAQDEQLERMFGAMRLVGGRPAVEFALAFAADKTQSENRRVRAVAAVEGKFDPKNPGDVQKLLSLAAADDTPDKIRDLVFMRVGEIPRDQVIAKLFEIFAAKRWQVRWVAAQTAIKMSNTTQIGEILAKLPTGKAENFALTEALTYGDWMGNAKTMPEKDGKTARAHFASSLADPNVAVRTTSLGFFFGHGTKADLPVVSPLENDKLPVPKCDDKQKDCDWKCWVPKEGGKPDEKAEKEVKTVGEFVKFCIVPKLNEAK